VAARRHGAVHDAVGEDCRKLDAALYLGTRGLPGGDPLARLLQRARHVRNRKSLPRLTIKRIMTWADQFSSPTDAGRTHQTAMWPVQSEKHGLRSTPPYTLSLADCPAA
jgi:hypothetical protein